jgi:hypothetical protein
MAMAWVCAWDGEWEETMVMVLVAEMVCEWAGEMVIAKGVQSVWVLEDR